MIITATYKGYMNQYFLFLTQQRIELKLAYYEMCGSFNIEPTKLAKIMQKYIGRKYKIAMYWDNYGYYVKQNKDKSYELYDSVTLLPVGVSYTALEGPPLEHEGKPVQRYKRRIVLRRIGHDTDRTS